MKLLASVLLLCGLALPAQASTYYASTSGSGSACSQASPCSLNTLISTLTAGDIGMVNPGTYTGGYAISGKSGTQANPITLRAVNPAVVCADPVNDPDGCEVGSGSRSIITGGGIDVGNNADWWAIEGFEVRSRGGLTCVGTSTGNEPANNTFRYIYATEVAALGGQGIMIDIVDCVNQTVEHSFGWVPHLNSQGPDYFIRLWAITPNFRGHNLYCAGGFHYCVNARNAAGPNITLTRIVAEGVELPAVTLGPTMDRNANGGPSCTNGVNEQTVVGVTLDRLFVRNATSGATTFPSRYGLSLSNVRDVLATNIFVANMAWNTNSAGIITQGSTFSGDTESCEGDNRIDPDNWTIRGAVVVNADTNMPCFDLNGNGYTVNLRIENFVAHDCSTAVGFGSWPAGNSPEDTAHPITILRNGVMNDCGSNVTGAVGGRLTQSHNSVFNCGTLSGMGHQTADPQFVGPETVPTKEIDLSVGERLWDWEGVYQPIIDRFRTQQASFVDAGDGNGLPCQGTCDIAVNEFFVPFQGGGGWIWDSCAVYGNGDEVFEPFANPWIDGRGGLVVDVDCDQKRIVIGRCDDPTDEETCDTDIYIHKAAQLRKQRTNVPITLSAGTTGADQDTSGTCWRTRATFDFTESLEELTGIWVRYQVDPDGGTHDCSATATPKFAWQGAE